MFAGYNLVADKALAQDFIKKGMIIYNENMKQVQKELDHFLQDDNSLNGTAMRDNWFPQIEADVFISHSHKDQNIALGLAGWLKEHFGLTAFIDSSVWGYAGDLLKEIDDKHCLQNNGNYSYQKRNHSTSHVHMMLSTALTMMMDKTECLIFINSQNSIETKGAIEQTKSPWIYLEIAMSKLIRKIKPERESVIIHKAFEDLSEQLTINYNLDLNHLADINYNHLISWYSTFTEAINITKGQVHPLDVLYKQHGFIENLDIINEIMIVR
ncbi:toll/interleukin-1 receptor domain-containing protein [Neobacillus niacini]|uniref:toll/interleukin-1 receptor domain-containing protein n=1 Tax=Neobacillus niacini TaxID=86668 RepID=UPI0005EE3E16|nr:toll/interleukin-1 receptor domain-containing protein [Neobacillus niacini]